MPYTPVARAMPPGRSSRPSSKRPTRSSKQSLRRLRAQSARPWRHQGGRLGPARPRRAAEVLAGAPAGAFRIVVCHHHLAGARGARRGSSRSSIETRSCGRSRTPARRSCSAAISTRARRPNGTRSLRSRTPTGARSCSRPPPATGARARTGWARQTASTSSAGASGRSRWRRESGGTGLSSPRRFPAYTAFEGCNRPMPSARCDERLYRTSEGDSQFDLRGQRYGCAPRCSGVALLCALAAAFAGAASKRTVIAFGSERGSPFRIHVLGMRPGVQQRTLQSAGTGMDVEPSWSPDGRRLAISTSDASGQDFDIAVVDANGSGRTRDHERRGWDEEPAWSPDGNWIAFASDRNGNFDIYAVRPDGTGLRQLTASTCEDTEPSWSPDGSRIVFTSRRGGFPHLWTMNADGTSERQAHEEHRLGACVVARRHDDRVRQRRGGRTTTRSTRSPPTGRTSRS